MHSYSAALAFIRSDSSATQIQPYVKRILLIATYRHGTLASTDQLPVPEFIDARIFLFIYLIAYFPKNVFASTAMHGVLEQRLLQAAVTLLVLFEKILLASSAHPCIPRHLTKDFTRDLYEYLHAFALWRVEDTQRLSLRVKRALVGLRQSLHSMDTDPAVAASLRAQRPEFVEQIQTLESKLVRLSGLGAVQQFDQDFKNGYVPGVGRTASTLPVDLCSSHVKASHLQLAHEVHLYPNFQLTPTCFDESPYESSFYTSGITPPCQQNTNQVILYPLVCCWVCLL